MKALKHIDLLGVKVSDKATGFTGVVTTVSFDLYGCIQAVVQPAATPENTLPQSSWFDVNRLVRLGERVMEVPDYDHLTIANGDRGYAEKPKR